MFALPASIPNFAVAVSVAVYLASFISEELQSLLNFVRYHFLLHRRFLVFDCLLQKILTNASTNHEPNNGTNDRAPIRQRLLRQTRRLFIHTSSPTSNQFIYIVQQLRLVTIRHHRHRRRHRPHPHHGPTHRYHITALRAEALSRDASERLSKPETRVEQ
jgi:hypothetical protein